jgi:hypothetical protein
VLCRAVLSCAAHASCPGGGGGAVMKPPVNCSRELCCSVILACLLKWRCLQAASDNARNVCRV